MSVVPPLEEFQKLTPRARKKLNRKLLFKFSGHRRNKYWKMVQIRFLYPQRFVLPLFYRRPRA